MEWTKYVLACTLGVCMLILFGRRDEGRDKWIFGLAVGGSLAAMELTVEYMYHKELWVMADQGNGFHTGRSHGADLWDKRRCAAGAGDWKAASLYGNNIDPGIFLQSWRTKATSLCDHAYEA